MIEYPDNYPIIFPLEEDLERAEARRVNLMRAPSYLGRSNISLNSYSQKQTLKYLKKVDIECDLAASPFAEIKTKQAFADAATATEFKFTWFATLTGFEPSPYFDEALATGLRRLRSLSMITSFSMLIRLEIKHVRSADYVSDIKVNYYEPHFHLMIIDGDKKKIREELTRHATVPVYRPLVMCRIKTAKEQARILNYISKGVQSHSEIILKKADGNKKYSYEGKTKCTAGFYETSILLDMKLKFWDFFATTKNLIYSPANGFFYGNIKHFYDAQIAKSRSNLDKVLQRVRIDKEWRIAFEKFNNPRRRVKPHLHSSFAVKNDETKFVYWT